MEESRDNFSSSFPFPFRLSVIVLLNHHPFHPSIQTLFWIFNFQLNFLLNCASSFLSLHEEQRTCSLIALCPQSLQIRYIFLLLSHAPGNLCSQSVLLLPVVLKHASSRAALLWKGMLSQRREWATRFQSDPPPALHLSQIMPAKKKGKSLPHRLLRHVLSSALAACKSNKK